MAKGGVAPLAGVFEYGEKITTQGFVYMDSPGYDPCSVTGQIASGANIIVLQRDEDQFQVTSRHLA